MNEWTKLIADTIPQFLFAIALFYLCQQNSNKQRDAYQQQITELYDMLRDMVKTINRTVSLMEENVSK